MCRGFLRLKPARRLVPLPLGSHPEIPPLCPAGSQLRRFGFHRSKLFKRPVPPVGIFGRDNLSHEPNAFIANAEIVGKGYQYSDLFRCLMTKFAASCLLFCHRRQSFTRRSLGTPSDRGLRRVLFRWIANQTKYRASANILSHIAKQCERRFPRRLLEALRLHNSAVSLQ